MVAVAWLLAKQWEEDFLESLAVVFPSYVTGLIFMAGAGYLFNAADQLAVCQ